MAILEFLSAVLMIQFLWDVTACNSNLSFGGAANFE